MTDTPQHIHKLQLEIWLSKSPGERLFQFLKDNDDMLNALIVTKKKLNISLPEIPETRTHQDKIPLNSDKNDARIEAEQD